MSKITSGNSAVTASPMASPLSAMPGPLEAVTPIAPPNAAPMAAVAAAISSSAWIVRTRNRLCNASSCRMSLAGVIGYAPYTTGSFERWGRQDPPRERAIAGHRPVEPRRHLRCLDRVVLGEDLGGLAIGVARLEHARVRLGDGRVLCEPPLDPLERGLERPRVDPQIGRAH